MLYGFILIFQKRFHIILWDNLFNSILEYLVYLVETAIFYYIGMWDMFVTILNN